MGQTDGRIMVSLYAPPTVGRVHNNDTTFVELPHVS